jgi:RimJ/RimL family protein N-acetyltransferase
MNHDQVLEQFGFTIKQLTLADAGRLQHLYDDCQDFAILTDGEPASPTAAYDEFFALPEFKNQADKFIFGLLNQDDQIIGMIESIRQYPDVETWWLGLMMLAPQTRGQGIGVIMLAWFESFAATHGAQKIMLSVVEVNEAGRKFWERAGFQHVRRTEPRAFGSKMHCVDVMLKRLA